MGPASVRAARFVRTRAEALLELESATRGAPRTSEEARPGRRSVLARVLRYIRLRAVRGERRASRHPCSLEPPQAQRNRSRSRRGSSGQRPEDETTPSPSTPGEDGEGTTVYHDRGGHEEHGGRFLATHPGLALLPRGSNLPDVRVCFYRCGPVERGRASTLEGEPGSYGLGFLSVPLRLALERRRRGDAALPGPRADAPDSPHNSAGATVPRITGCRRTISRR